VADPRLELGVDYPALTCGWVSYIGTRTSSLFFWFGEICLFRFAFCFADRAEPVVDDFLVLRCRLHAWVLVWGTCLPIRIFSLSSAFSTAVALFTNGHLWTWTFVTTRPRSLLAHTHTHSIHSSYSIRSSNLIYRTLSCLYFCTRTPFPYCFPISLFLGVGYFGPCT
jgi:hypothetical protein